MLKGERIRALGAMSGTSLDGVDAAVIETDGAQIFGLGESHYRPYSEEERAVLRDALGFWPGKWCDAALDVVQRAHREVLAGFRGVDIVGFHGQTLAHEPRGRGTHQLGDGDALAQELGMPVVWDFRSADVALGGEGAPLAPFYHFACAQWMGAKAPVAFLNLGGVGNITWVDPRHAAPEDLGALLAFDTGPANAPINDVMQARRGLAFDEGGALALEGRADQDVVRSFLSHGYFHRIPPKSLDRDEFKSLPGMVAALDDADAVATLVEICAASVARGLEHCPEPPAQVLVTGGGRKNPALMARLAALLPCDVAPVEEVGLDGDMLEAQAFAFLAVRVARGLPTSCPGTTGVAGAVAGGTLSRPERAA